MESTFSLNQTFATDIGLLPHHVSHHHLHHHLQRQSKRLRHSNHDSRGWSRRWHKSCRSTLGSRWHRPMTEVRKRSSSECFLSHFTHYKDAKFCEQVSTKFIQLKAILVLNLLWDNKNLCSQCQVIFPKKSPSINAINRQELLTLTAGGGSTASAAPPSGDSARNQPP